MTLLRAQNLTMKFSGLVAVDDLTLEVSEHELVGVIGPNGAGKTTFFNILSGIYSPTAGRIIFQGKEVAHQNQSQMAKSGICRTFQNIRLFDDLSVFDNVLLAFHCQANYGIWANLFRTRSFKKKEQALKEKTLELLKVFNLAQRSQARAKELPYGQQRRLEMARALATGPKVLLLDEPAAGMNPKETGDLCDLIRWIKERFALTIVLIEHDMALVMKICERILVMDQGRAIAQGPPSAIQENPRVIEAYLGVSS